ncbi:amidohydrolase family protein [Chloroflexota bacterium]
MVIDFHTHVLPPRIKENRQPYLEKDAAFAAIYGSAQARIATTEELLASMENDGVAVSVITNYSWASRELLTETNDYIIESVSRYPERLVGFCALPLGSTDNALTEIERCAVTGIRGVGELRPDLPPVDFTDTTALKPIIEALIARNLMLMLHVSEPVGHSYPGKGTVTPDIIYPLITRFPELTLICAHWGGGLPFYALMPEVKKALRNVYFDTAASPFLYHHRIYPQVSQLIGAEKILFGSDYPLLPPSRYLKQIATADLREADKELILGGNARRLLNV